MPYIAAGEEIYSDRSSYIGLARKPIPVTVVSAEYGDDDEPDYYVVRIKHRDWIVWGSSLRMTVEEVVNAAGWMIAEMMTPDPAEPVDAIDDDDVPF